MSTPQRPAEVVNEVGKKTHHLSKAWASLAMFPLTMPVSILVMYTVLAFTGYSDARAAQTPWWSYAISGVVALAVLASPLALTIPATVKAKAAGEPYARLPLVLAAILIGAFVLVTAVPTIVGALLGF